jgi:hypothetical protein
MTTDTYKARCSRRRTSHLLSYNSLRHSQKTHWQQAWPNFCSKNSILARHGAESKCGEYHAARSALLSQHTSALLCCRLAPNFSQNLVVHDMILAACKRPILLAGIPAFFSQSPHFLRSQKTESIRAWACCCCFQNVLSPRKREKASPFL